MTDRPIIFSAPMIRSLLDGRKTQTRRILKEQPEVSYVAGWGIGREGYPDEWTPLNGPTATAAGWNSWKSKHVPRFAPGDRLWVRESCCIWGDAVYYRENEHGVTVGLGGFAKWRPSIHMPRWASRLTLIVESVKVGRLQEISEEDARAEGFPINHNGEPYEVAPVGSTNDWNNYGCASFFLLWSKLHGGESLDANPWVCAISFRTVKANIDAPEVAP